MSRCAQEEISNIVTSPVLDCRGDSAARVAESNVADTPNMGNKAYSSSKSMGQEHRQQSSQSMGSNNSSKRIGNNIGGGSSNSKSMGSSSIGQEEHWTRRVAVNSKSNSDISSKSNSGISSSKSSRVSSISSKSSSDRI